ncbi:MAG: helix-turn-helix transcriptional regulator [Bryobacterales bacterium]|nr:helix-turn-helix transcriptional regulator [Bryobacterales bacterium]
MKDSNSSLDYGEQLVLRYRASGMTRQDFAARSGISVSTLDTYARRERKASLPYAFAPSRLLPVEFTAPPEEETPQAGAPELWKKAEEAVKELHERAASTERPGGNGMHSTRWASWNRRCKRLHGWG